VLDEAYVPFLSAFGAAWDDHGCAWSVNPRGMLWPEMGCGVRQLGQRKWGPAAAARRPVVVIAAS
jgi:hypothetical protein